MIFILFTTFYYYKIFNIYYITNSFISNSNMKASGIGVKFSPAQKQ